MRLFLIVCAFLLVACNRIPQVMVSDCVCERLSKNVYWQRGKDPEICRWITNATAQPLTRETAVQIALLQNPDIQVLFEKIGIAQADLIQAGLLRNPVFDSYFRFPDVRGLMIDYEINVTFYFIDLLLTPLKRRAALADLAQVEFEVTHAILNLAFQVERVYYQLAAELLQAVKLQAIVDLWQAASDERKLIPARLALEHTHLNIITLKAQLNQLLGFNSTSCWEIMPDLPPPTPLLPDLCYFQNIALENRLDFTAFQWQVERFARQGALKHWWAYTEFLAGISSEREDTGERVTGPAVSFSIPIFDSGQAARLRLKAQLQQSIDMLNSLRIKILTDVEQSYKRLEVFHAILCLYQQELSQRQDAETEKIVERFLLENLYLTTLRDFWVEFTLLKQSMDTSI